MVVWLSPMTDYFCLRCNAKVRPDEKLCWSCGADLSQIGRKIVVSLDEKVSVKAQIAVRAQVTAGLPPRKGTSSLGILTCYGKKRKTGGFLNSN